MINIIKSPLSVKVYVTCLLAALLFIGMSLFSDKLFVAEASAANIAVHKTATSNCSSAPYSAEKAVDGSTNPTSRWYCSTGTAGGAKWLELDLGRAYPISGYSVTGMGLLGKGWGVDRNPRNFRLQTSTDRTTWTDVDTVTNNSLSLVNRTVSVFSSRYVRLYIDQGNQNNNYWTSVMEFQVFEASLSSNSNLSGLQLSSGTLNPAFASGNVIYTSTVANSVTSITVTPTTADTLATVTINGSAVTSGQPSGAIGLGVGNNLITIIVKAQDGSTKTYNVTVNRSNEAVLDKTAPETALSTSLLDGQNGWFKTIPTITMSAIDKPDPSTGASSGVAETFYRINSGIWQTYTAPFKLYTEGTSTVDYYSRDNAGNIEAVKTSSFKMDVTPPITKSILAPIYGLTKSGKSYIKGFTATLTATDNVSTVTGTVYSINQSVYQPYIGPFTFYANDTTSLQYFSADGAGNQESPNVYDFVTGTFTGNK